VDIAEFFNKGAGVYALLKKIAKNFCKGVAGAFLLKLRE